MNEPSLRTIALDSDRLEDAIGVLAMVAEDYGLTRLERIGYRILMVSVDVAIVSLAVICVALAGVIAAANEWLGLPSAYPGLGLEVVVIGAFGLLASSAVGLLALLLNIPLFFRTVREWAQLRALGMTSLSKLLWKARQRRHWVGQVRSTLILFFGVVITLLGLAAATLFQPRREDFILAAFCVVVVVILLGSRHLRNRREQMSLAANADELMRALQDLRHQAGPTRTIDVPAELVEQAAKVESTYIAKTRTAAILEGTGSAASGYAIQFADEAARERSALDLPDRLELEDLLARLSTEGAPNGPQPGPPAPAAGVPTRSISASGRIAAEYVVEDPRSIRITAVTRPAGEAGSPATGASDV